MEPVEEQEWHQGGDQWYVVEGNDFFWPGGILGRPGVVWCGQVWSGQDAVILERSDMGRGSG